MRRLESAVVTFAAAVAMFGATSVLAGEGVPPNAPAHAQVTVDGPILVTPQGMALYTGASAIAGPGGGGGGGRGGPMRCTDQRSIAADDQQSGLGSRPVLGAKYITSCLEQFPPYLADANAQPAGDFTIIDGLKGKQWAWQGRPLHLSTKDKKPGDRNAAGGGGGFGGGGGRGGGMRLATLPVEFPMGLRLSPRDEGSVLTTSDGKAVYTPKKGTKADPQFKPIVAPAMATVSGDMSIVDAGPGRKQYAFRGKPLFAAPGSLQEGEIEAIGGWELVVYHPSEGRPREIGRQATLNGEVYTTKDGLSLYTYSCSAGAATCDDPGGPAAPWVALCGSADECASRWKPYIVQDGVKPVGDWSVVEVAYPMFTDPQGIIYPPEAPRVKAWALRGKPLYTYYEDKHPGDMWGDSTAGLWGGGSFGLVRVPGRGLIE